MSKSYSYVQLEDMLGQIYSGRANAQTIDALLEWLNERKKAADLPLAPDACPYCKGTRKGKLSGVEVGCIMCRDDKWDAYIEKVFSRKDKADKYRDKLEKESQSKGDNYKVEEVDFE